MKVFLIGGIGFMGKKNLKYHKMDESEMNEG